MFKVCGLVGRTSKQDDAVISTRKKQAEAVTWASGIITTSGVVRSGPQREEWRKHWRKGGGNSLGRRERLKPYKRQLTRVGWVGKRSEGRRVTVTVELPLCPQLSTQLCFSVLPFFPHPLCFHSAPAYRVLTLLGSQLGVNGYGDIPFPHLPWNGCIGEAERCKMRRFWCSGAGRRGLMGLSWRERWLSGT